ncbi:MAG: Uma2 family endonuclease [Oscillatoriales cyanobacterium]|uniref:Uma2 family endonuclease n=1 Tax=Microcoleus anatoxicus PTRS2 TaxID=2705321 RepID=A0ABU8YQX4_9CYAN|nr:MAG: Uma2 family endonuclease [Oscillatoriales cyanobacterium]TAE01972.1 MAG: Uma2 family endonuclease [Oscillatoriales cyanobacterium]TAE04699.1 MAG: Uma2 family endonuclease [Oscillatoriales cyanobacterium]TAF04736.1 MAG: Uma2 family endonuclease [Oscillatoriales cyanobacterium]TAF47875.1 MAG: Uma2 family endonuclease [Oscillatoriales cyanobacterium]
MTAILQVTEQPTAQDYFTPEEYLALEEAAEYKSEYLDGVIIPMTGGTTNHNRISLNMSIALRLALKGLDYDVFIGDVRLWLPKKRFYTYPDVMVIPGKPEYYNNRQDTVMNPQAIVEVLSKSTKAYDRTDKFKLYQTIPTFQEYILIDQSQVYIEQYCKLANKRWSYRQYDEEDATLVFNFFQVEVALADVYEKVDFEAENEAEESGEE